MKSDQIRQTFLKFFEERGHAIIPSAPVVPHHVSAKTQEVLFTTAGMHPLVPYLLGEPHPAGKRLADVQKCIRTGDIDEIGDESHLTFFEMLGNWSLGDYFKEDAITWSWELLTSKEKGFGLDKSKLAVSVFKGDEDAPKDEEAAELWRKQGVPDDRIFYYGKEDNWWGPAGQAGPCGPDTEIFYWTGDGKPESEPATDDRWLEIWNNVFMQYEKTDGGKFEPLAQKNVDTGMGLERLAVILQGKKNVYETDLFESILAKVRELSNANQTDEKAERVIADHLKAATFMIADGVKPSNEDRGYVVRKLIRRAIRQGKYLETAHPFTGLIADVIVSEFSNHYPELKKEAKTIQKELVEEEEKFAKTLSTGLRELEHIMPVFKSMSSVALSSIDLANVISNSTKLTSEAIKNIPLQSINQASSSILNSSGSLLSKDLLSNLAKQATLTSQIVNSLPLDEISRSASTVISSSLAKSLGNQSKQFYTALSGSIGNSAFKLFDTYGFPNELTKEELNNNNVGYDEEVADKVSEKEFKAHQEKSRSGAEQKFAGGLVDHSDKVVRQHTATHLLLAALRDVLGDEVRQRGSNITAERLRFDFSYGEKLTDEQRNQVEALVNEWIKEDLPVTRKEMPKAEAEKLGAQSEFGHKYPDVVSVYLIGDSQKEISIEFCGGPHVERTGEIGTFTLKKQESVGAGVRRIKAVIE